MITRCARPLIALAAALLLVPALSACSTPPPNTRAATSIATPTPTPTPTPTTAAQGVEAMQGAIAKMSPAQIDAAFLAGARSTIKSGTDADLIALGHKLCTDFAAGVDMAGRVADVTAAGFPAKEGFGLIIVASLTYCPKK